MTSRSSSPRSRAAWSGPLQAGSESAATGGLASRRPPRRRTLAQTAAGLGAAGLWLALDLLLAGVAVIAAHAVSPLVVQSPLGPAARRAALVYAAAFVIAGLGAGLYDRGVWRSRRLIAARVAVAALLAAGVTVVFYQPLGRRVTLASLAFTLPLLVLPRFVLWEVQRRRPRRLLFVGDDALQRRTQELLAEDPDHHYEVAGVLRPGSGDDLCARCQDDEVDELLLPQRVEELQPLLAAALACLPLGCRVRAIADFYEDVFRLVPVRHVSAAWLLARGWDSSDHLREAVKRWSDVALAALLLIAGAPLIAAVAVVQRLSGAGPTFYVQTRVGRYGRPFHMFKLRTMRVDAEAAGPLWAAPDDERRTRLGVLLRRTRLDELPQALNILRGDMSFVGPRPERPEFVAELERSVPFYAWRHLVRPGLTGWAQINYPYGASSAEAERKLEYDLWYLRHLSLLTDAVIVLRTASEALRGSR